MSDKMSSWSGISLRLLDPKFHHCVHKALPLISVLIQLNPVHTSTSYFPKIKFNIIFSSMPPYVPLSFLSERFSDKKCVCIFNFLMHSSCPFYDILLYLITITISDKEFTLYTFLHSFVSLSETHKGSCSRPTAPLLPAINLRTILRNCCVSLQQHFLLLFARKIPIIISAKDSASFRFLASHVEVGSPVNTCLEQHDQTWAVALSNSGQLTPYSPPPPTARAVSFGISVPHWFFILFARSLSHQYIIESWSCILNQKDWSIMK